VIIGAGPCGIGAAWYLHRSGYPDWNLYEKNPFPGGLSASFRDAAGFTWDVGGHVLFSRYGEFESFLRGVLRDDYRVHARDARVLSCGRWVPYPFQNNIDALPSAAFEECISGLASVAGRRAREGANFREWIDSTYGEGISKYCLTGLNRKTWACRLEDLSTVWVDERVSPPTGMVPSGEPGGGWGPHRSFRYPSRGGIGALWEGAASALGGHVQFCCEVEKVRPDARRISFRGGGETGYDLLISSMDVRRLVRSLHPADARLEGLSRALRCPKILIIGIGLGRKGEDSRSWMYFPDRVYPFFRVTNLSNYSPENVPGGDVRRHCSLLVEIAYAEGAEVDRAEMTERSIDGLMDAGLLSAGDRALVESVFTHEAEPAYPLPTIGRDPALAGIHERLEPMGIFSRGRFGAFLYEKGNMDDCFMQGYEAARRAADG